MNNEQAYTKKRYSLGQRAGRIALGASGAFFTLFAGGLETKNYLRVLRSGLQGYNIKPLPHAAHTDGQQNDALASNLPSEVAQQSPRGSLRQAVPPALSPSSGLRGGPRPPERGWFPPGAALPPRSTRDFRSQNR
jgi:hypothetical protein